jgi:hypothetical protein
MMSKLKLYTATVTFDYVVVAEDEDNADMVAREYAKDALGDISMFDVDIGIVKGWNAAIGWDVECIPYGGDGNTRTGDYIKESE